MHLKIWRDYNWHLTASIRSGRTPSSCLQKKRGLAVNNLKYIWAELVPRFFDRVKRTNQTKV